MFVFVFHLDCMQTNKEAFRRKIYGIYLFNEFLEFIDVMQWLVCYDPEQSTGEREERKNKKKST